MTHLEDLKITLLRELCELFEAPPGKSKIDIVKNINTVAIDHLTVTRLQEICGKIGLSKSGTKKELIARLDQLRRDFVRESPKIEPNQPKITKELLILENMTLPQLTEMCRLLSINIGDKDDLRQLIKTVPSDHIKKNQLSSVAELIGLLKSGKKEELMMRFNEWRKYVQINQPSVSDTRPVNVVQTEKEDHEDNKDDRDDKYDEIPTKMVVGKLPKEYHDMLSKMANCSSKDTRNDKTNKIYNYLLINNQLKKYLNQLGADWDFMYLLLLLDDNGLDHLFKRVMKEAPEIDRFSKILAILENYSQLTKKSNGKKTISQVMRENVWLTYMGGNAIGKCYCCQMNEINTFNFEAGHVIPESRGGMTIKENLRPVCSICNKSMGTKDMKEFARQNCPQSPILKEP